MNESIIRRYSIEAQKPKQKNAKRPSALSEAVHFMRLGWVERAYGGFTKYEKRPNVQEKIHEHFARFS